MTKILLVEDSELSRDMLSRRLTRRGYEVVLAADGLEGVSKASSESPDVILMDMTLPVLDGLESTRRIKTDPRTRSIPIIALTAGTLAEDESKALEAGCSAFHTKPGDFDALIAMIDKLAAKFQS
jgi:CheY-like chemotaxis protein